MYLINQSACNMNMLLLIKRQRPVICSINLNSPYFLLKLVRVQSHLRTPHPKSSKVNPLIHNEKKAELGKQNLDHKMSAHCMQTRSHVQVHVTHQCPQKSLVAILRNPCTTKGTHSRTVLQQNRSASEPFCRRTVLLQNHYTRLETRQS